MRRRDCVRNLDTPLVCAERHRQMTIKCAYSYYYSRTCMNGRCYPSVSLNNFFVLSSTFFERSLQTEPLK